MSLKGTHQRSNFNGITGEKVAIDIFIISQLKGIKVWTCRRSWKQKKRRKNHGIEDYHILCREKDNKKLNLLYSLVGDIPISSWWPITWCDNRSAILSSCANLKVDCKEENYISKTEHIDLVKKRVLMKVEQDVCYQLRLFFYS